MIRLGENKEGVLLVAFLLVFSGVVAQVSAGSQDSPIVSGTIVTRSAVAFRVNASPAGFFGPGSATGAFELSSSTEQVSSPAPVASMSPSPVSTSSGVISGAGPVTVQGGPLGGLAAWAAGWLSSSSSGAAVVSAQPAMSGGQVPGAAGMAQVTFATGPGSVSVSAAAAVPPGSLASPSPAVLIGTESLTPITSQAPGMGLSLSTDAVPRLWLDASKRRSRSQIYIEIVELLARGPMTPFEVAFYARLNHKRTKEYIEFLKSSGYLEMLDEDGRRTCAITPDGMSFLERLRTLFLVDKSPAALRRSNYS